MNTVKAWIEDVIIPTYEIGEEEKNPVFLEKRVYQGSSGAVYPYPVIEKIYDEKINKVWKAIYLENKYVKIMILPQLGGRVQMAYDKVKQRHFVYYNQVIKPALVGLAGPWISGGIEFNWPQHHRPTTYQEVDHLIEENDDGSITVWCSEIERMFRTRGMAGFTLYPDKAFLEVKVKLYNRTPQPQTFLWWANPAVKVNDHYQSVFPPDVKAVYDHGKRDVSTFPIATRTYYKVDYSAGVDISKYKNIPVPTSYMAVQSGYDFIGCYEHDSKGGMLHVADHHISPGKKQWTWGNGDFGQAWDRNLTDEDGPYIELMCGVYTDNQPDFSWIMPYEEKTFKQYFIPFHNIGGVKNANRDALVNLEYDGKFIKVGVYVTSEFSDSKVILKYKGANLFETRTNLTTSEPFVEEYLPGVAINPNDLSIVVKKANGLSLISWQPETHEKNNIPEPAKAAKAPQDITQIEQLYLTGLHLEQYRHATFSPQDYYREALKRDPADSRCNNAMGLLDLKKGNFTKAQTYFEKAIATLTDRNPNPYDGEAWFNLGLALRFQYKEEEAFNAFHKAIWNDAWQAAGYFQLAQIAAKSGQFEDALEYIEKSLLRQWHNHKARHLKVALLRLSGNTEAALVLIEDSIRTDRFNFGIIYEKYLLTDSENTLTELNDLMRRNIHSYIEISLDYAWAGLYQEAISLLSLGIKEQAVNVYPMVWYYLGWYHSLINNQNEALTYYDKAEKEDPGTCFPNQLESILALNDCIRISEIASKAPYYLGNFQYHIKEYKKAVHSWEASSNSHSNFPTVHRNLALAYFNKSNDKDKALQELEKAFELDTSDARVLMELDALYKRTGKSYTFRLQTLEKFPDLLNFRDDLYLEKIALLNFLDRHDEAYELLMKRKFHPWEGGEGKVTGQYVLCLIEMAKGKIKAQEYQKAIELLEKAKSYPHNLGEGKLVGELDNDINFWLGYSHEILGNKDKANSFYNAAIIGDNDPSEAMFYNDQQPDKIFYQGLALLKLNRKKEAKERFDKLIRYGENHISDQVKIDYFAVSLPYLMIWEDDLNLRNTLHCKYLIALGNMGLGKQDEAKKIFSEILDTDVYHTGSFMHLKLLENELIKFFNY